MLWHNEHRVRVKFARLVDTYQFIKTLDHFSFGVHSGGNMSVATKLTKCLLAVSGYGLPSFVRPSSEIQFKLHLELVRTLNVTVNTTRIMCLKLFCFSFCSASNKWSRPTRAFYTGWQTTKRQSCLDSVWQPHQSKTICPSVSKHWARFIGERISVMWSIRQRCVVCSLRLHRFNQYLSISFYQ